MAEKIVGALGNLAAQGKKKLEKGKAGLKDDLGGIQRRLSLHKGRLEDYYEDISEQPEARFCRTYLARHKTSGEYRSIQKVPKSSMREVQDQYDKGVKVFQALYHPNILHLYETLEDRKYYYVVVDRTDNPNLYQAIPKLFPNPQDFDETQVALIVRTILRALEFCHKNSFPHTGLTYHNILVPPTRGLQGLYIIGFGFARLDRLEPDDSEDNGDLDESNKSEEGPAEDAVKITPKKDWFAAPETLWGGLSMFEAPCDIWSAGIITYQLLTRHHPFEDPNVSHKSFEDKAWREDHFRNHPFLDNVSAPGRDFVKQLLTFNDFDRPTAAQALEHEWLKTAGKVGKTARKEEALDRLDNLASFDAKNRLEESARLYIATNLLHVKERAKLDRIFHYLDIDKKDQGLTKSDLKIAFRKAQGEEQAVKVEKMLETTFDRLDKEKKGIINYNQFLAAAADDEILLTKRNLKATFDAIDKSKTGTLSADDLKAFFCQGENKQVISRRDIRRIIKQVDSDCDGEISFDDFCELMLARPEEVWPAS